MKQEKKKTEKNMVKKIARTLPECQDRDCPIHGKLRARGRSYEGKVVKIFPRRLKIRFERMVYLKKYERYTKSETNVHARIPKCVEGQINVGDLIKVQECRPLSKIIHFVVVKKIKSGEEK